MNTRKLTAAAAVLLAAAALSGCGPDDTEQRVATVRAGMEAQIAYHEGGCGTPTPEQARAHAAALAITDPGFLRDRLDNTICEDGRFMPVNPDGLTRDEFGVPLVDKIAMGSEGENR